MIVCLSPSPSLFSIFSSPSLFCWNVLPSSGGKDSGKGAVHQGRLLCASLQRRGIKGQGEATDVSRSAWSETGVLSRHWGSPLSDSWCCGAEINARGQGVAQAAHHLASLAIQHLTEVDQVCPGPF